MRLIFTIITGIILVGCAAGVGTFYLSESKRYELAKLDAQARYEKELAELQEQQNKELARIQREYLQSPPAAAYAPKPLPPPPPAPQYRDNFKFEKGEPKGGGSKIDIRPLPASPVFSAKGKETVSSKLFNASMAFAIKDQVNLKEDIKAQLLIDPSQSVKDLENKLTVKGTNISQTVSVSEIVKATIIAPDFDVTKVTDEEQVVSDYKPTEWLWILKAKSVGTHEVNLSVTAVIKINGRETKHHLKTFDKTIIVEVTREQMIMGWVKEHWKWFLSTLVVPLVVFVYKQRKKQ